MRGRIGMTVLVGMGLLGCSEPQESPTPPIADTAFMLGGNPRLVFFASGDATVEARQMPKLRSFVADYHSEFPDGRNMFVYVTGHTDNTGDGRRNTDLSVRRAQAVAELLRQEGLPAGQLVVMGCGANKLLLQTPPNTKEPQNNRVEVRGVWRSKMGDLQCQAAT